MVSIKFQSTVFWFEFVYNIISMESIFHSLGVIEFCFTMKFFENALLHDWDRNYALLLQLLKKKKGGPKKV